MLSVHGSPLAQLGTREAGGMQAYIRALSRELGRRGTRVDVFTRRTEPHLPEISWFGENARVIALDAGEARPIDKDALFELLPEFLGNLQGFQRKHELDYDLIHGHYWLSGWVGTHLARRWNVPLVTMFHTLALLKGQIESDDHEATNRVDVESRVIAGSDRIIAASEHEREALVERYHARRSQVSVIPCGVDLDLFRPGDRAAARARLELAGDVLLFVGRMDPIKGIDLLLRSFAQLKDRPDLTAVLVGGSGAEREMARIRELATDLGISHRVRFRGSVPQDGLVDYYRAATVTVVPSHYESFGLVALESLACGTPVVGSRVGGLPTVIHDGSNGLLVPWRTPRAFAEAIETLLDERALLDDLRARARPSVLRYGWSAIGSEVLRVYQQLTRERAPALACFDRV